MTPVKSQMPQFKERKQETRWQDLTSEGQTQQVGYAINSEDECVESVR